MPGPYDLAFEPESYSERLPLGIGSDNLIASVALPLGLATGSSLLTRYGIKTAYGFTGKGSMYGARPNTVLARINQQTRKVKNFDFGHFLATKGNPVQSIRQTKRLRVPPSSGNILKGTSLIRAGQHAAGLSTAIGAAVTLAVAADITKSVGEAAIDWRPRKGPYSPHEFGHVYYDPRGAYTQRQRALQAIHESQLTSRAMLGGEAAFMHR